MWPPVTIDAAFARRFINAYRRQPGKILRAMRLAGFDGPEPEALTEGTKLLDGPVVKAVLEAPMTFRYSVEDVLEETAEIAFAPWKDFVIVQLNKDGDTIRATMDLKSKVGALEKLGEFFGLWGRRLHKRPKDHKELAKMLAEEIRRVNGDSGIPLSIRRDAETKQPS